MRFRCPNCQQLFELDVLPQSGKTACPTCGQGVKVGSIPAPVRPTAPAPDFSSVPNFHPPITLPAYLTQPPPPPRPAPTRSTSHEVERRGRQSSGSNVVVWIVLGWVGLLGFIVCGGVVGFLVYNAGMLGGTEMTLAGYSAKAPGRLAVKEGAGSVRETGILNPRTGSQFQLIFVESTPLRVATPENFLQGIQLQSASVTSNPITRAGLSGFHFEADRAFNGADGEGEVFAIQGGVLLVLYQPGSSLALAKGNAVKYSGDRERSADGVDAFFASLSRK